MIPGQAPPLSGLGSGQGLGLIPLPPASQCGRSDQMEQAKWTTDTWRKTDAAHFFFSMYIFYRFFFFFFKMSQFFHNL